MLQYPQRNALVSGHPEVCAACQENPHQNQKCNTLNYNEWDPFLCISYMFSKYSQCEGWPTMDRIENEDDWLKFSWIEKG